MIFLTLVLQVLILLCSYLAYKEISEIIYTLPTSSASVCCCSKTSRAHYQSVFIWQTEASRPSWKHKCNSGDEYTEYKEFAHLALGLRRLEESHIYTNPSNPPSCNSICRSINLPRNKNYSFHFLFPVCRYCYIHLHSFAIWSLLV